MYDHENAFSDKYAMNSLFFSSLLRCWLKLGEIVERMELKKKCYEKHTHTSELVKQFCGSSRFLRRFRGANSVCGESCGGGGIADAAWNNVGGDFDASPSDW